LDTQPFQPLCGMAGAGLNPAALCLDIHLDELAQRQGIPMRSGNRE
jgi:hypothetical protein